ncbi:MAG TPA: hydrogen peroxide-dependent heme synthase [Bryobacteraceae bacterium]|jgi:peroxiredoxin|nr:hydrogen peroxide-dependent heme synthase [Bryobacteraceae bacterium]
MYSFENLPAMPLTIEGASLLHQMFRVKWPSWRALAASERGEILRDAASALTATEADGTAVFSMLGHKGDIMLVHFRKDFAALNQVELALVKLKLWDYLEQTTSYLSVVELGLYESSEKVYTSLAERGVAPYSPEWNAEIEETLARQRAAMHPRLFPEIPGSQFISFYPMDRRRGEHKNWYKVPMPERQRQMQDHGEIGRRYAGKVRQIISGSIGFDDWEWGVDLFADDPLIFKKLIYEMRFDEVSAVYALFGTFYIGRRVAANEIGSLLEV